MATVAHSEPAQQGRAPLLARALALVFADLIAAALLITFALSPVGNRLLYDASVGWHIRNGQHILTTHAIPRADYLTYTMVGKPWFNSTWLWDVAGGWLDRLAGLNGIVVANAIILAVIFTLLYRHCVARSGNALVAAVFTVLAFIAAFPHLAAGPQLVTSLLVLVYVALLEKVASGKTWPAFAIPGLMLAWVNLDPGFIIGLAVCSLYFIGALVALWSARNVPEARRSALSRAGIFFAAVVTPAAASLANPYGYRLHVHLFRAIHTDELGLSSPNFHAPLARAFLALLLLSLVALAAASRPRAIDALLVGLAAVIALRAATLIPVAAILLATVAAPLLSSAFEQPTHAHRYVQKIIALLDRVGRPAPERRPHVPFAPIAIAVFAIIVAFNSGRAGSRTLMHYDFAQPRVPVQAARMLFDRFHVRTHFFAPASWAGYIYYVYFPRGVRNGVDDRRDLYAPDFYSAYESLRDASDDWSTLPDDYDAKYLMMPAHSAIANLLAASQSWQLEYSDNVAVIYARRPDAEISGNGGAPR